MLKWGDLGQENFDRITTALIKRKHPHARKVVVPDARGGDDGIDILVEDTNETWLYQQKYFREGFSGGYAKTRRAQIRSSFDQAMKLKPRPDVWALLVPRDLTNAERAVINALPDRIKDEGPRPRIEAVGQTELDELVIENSDIEKFALRDATREALELAVGDQLAANMMISNVEDYTARLSAVNAEADAVDTDWTTRPILDSSGQEAVAIIPKHKNPQPIIFSLQLDEGDFDNETRDRYEDVIGYGLPGELVVNTPPGKSIYHQAPAFLLSSHDPTNNYQWKISPASENVDPLVGQRVVMHLEYASRTKSSHVLTITQLTRGAFGMAIELKLTDICQLLFKLPEPDPLGVRVTHGNLGFTTELGTSRPEDTLEALDLQRDISAATRVILDLPGMGLLTMERTATEPVDEDVRKEHENYRLLMEDLTVIQRETRQKFIPPEDMTLRERTLVRFLRLLLEGHVVSIPGIRRLQVTLNEDRLEDSENMAQGQGFCCTLTQETFTVNLWNMAFTVPGPVWTYHPRVELEPIEGSGSRISDDNTAHIRPLEEEYFVAYMPDRLKATSKAPTPWGLDGIEEQKTYTLTDSTKTSAGGDPSPADQ